MSGADAPRVIRAPNPSPMTLDGTRTFLVGRARPVVIDPGPADPAHLAAIEQALAGARPLAILLTHAHPDHSAAAPPLARTTGASVLMAAGAIGSAIDPASVTCWIEDGEVIETDAGTLRAIATPGHTPEHLCFLWSGGNAPPDGALFVGDLLMGEGDTTLIAPPEGDLADYFESLERVRELRPEVLFPAHGGPLEDPPKAVRRYLAHRKERLRQVLGMLAAKASATVPELVGCIYGSELPPALAGAAAASVQAMLDHLEKTGQAERLPGGRFTNAR